MSEQFAHLGITFERVAAVDGGAISDDQFLDFQRSRPLACSGDSLSTQGRQWSRASMGCFLSHYRIWKQISGQSSALSVAIFEDDMILSEDIRSVLNDHVWALDKSYDIVRLEASYNRVKLGPSTGTLPNGRSLTPVIQSKREQAWPIGAGSYLITPRAAAKLIGAQTQMHTFADIFMFNPLESPVARTLSIGQVAPALCIQQRFSGVQEIDSDIAPATSTPLGIYLKQKFNTLSLTLLRYRKVGFA